MRLVVPMIVPVVEIGGVYGLWVSRWDCGVVVLLD